MYNVQKFTTRHGKVKLYFRKAGMARVALKSPLPDVWEGSDLKAEVDALLGLAKPRTTPGTLRGAVRAYELDSPDFDALAASTKALYRAALYELDEELGHLPVETFIAPYLMQLRALWAKRNGHRGCNIRLQVLKNALRPAVIAGLIGGGDPFAVVPGAPRPADLAEPHTIWPESVVETVIEAAIAQKRYGLARAVALARYAGPRRGDLIKLSRVNRAGGRLAFLSGKRRVPVDIPEDPALTRWLDATPATQPLSRWQLGADRRKGITRLPASTLVYNLEGRRYTEDGLGQELAKLVAALHEAQAIDRAGYDLHGLRHTRGVELALAGCSDAEGAASLGHGSPHSFAQYRRQADRVRLGEGAADKVKALRERTGNADLSNQVSNTCQTSPQQRAEPMEKPQ